MDWIIRMSQLCSWCEANVCRSNQNAKILMADYCQFMIIRHVCKWPLHIHSAIDMNSLDVIASFLGEWPIQPNVDKIVQIYSQCHIEMRRPHWKIHKQPCEFHEMATGWNHKSHTHIHTGSNEWAVCCQKEIITIVWRYIGSFLCADREKPV